MRCCRIGLVIWLGYSVHAQRCESWCSNPCSELNGNFQDECGACVGDDYQCKGFLVDALGNVESVQVLRWLSEDVESNTTTGDFSSGTVPGSSASAAAVNASELPDFDFRSWRRCLPDGNDVPHAHDSIHSNHNEDLFDVSCLMRHHTTYYGRDFLPRHGLRGVTANVTSSSSPAGCKQLKGHGESFGHQGQQQKKIAEVSGCLDSPTFLRDYVRLQRPIVMRGCASVHPAATRWTSDEYLKRVAGDWVDPGFGNFGEWIQEYKEQNHYGSRLIEDQRQSAPMAAALLDDLLVPPSLLE